jgi:hypothetical protein
MKQHFANKREVIFYLECNGRQGARASYGFFFGSASKPFIGHACPSRLGTARLTNSDARWSHQPWRARSQTLTAISADRTDFPLAGK